MYFRQNKKWMEFVLGCILILTFFQALKPTSAYALDGNTDTCAARGGSVTTIYVQGADGFVHPQGFCAFPKDPDCPAGYSIGQDFGGQTGCVSFLNVPPPPPTPDTTTSSDGLTPCDRGDPSYNWYEVYPGGARTCQPKGTIGGVIASIAKRPFINAAVWLSNLLVSFSGLLVGMAGKLLDFIINITIQGMGEFVKKVAGINIAWRLIRDTLTIGLSFIVLYAALGLILHIPKAPGKGVISGSILFGLLINFSLLIARVPIDLSNIFTTELYQPMKEISQVGDQLRQNQTQTDFSIGGFSNVFLQALKIQSVRDNTGVQLQEDSQVIIINIMSSLFLLIAAFVFFAASFLFVQVFVERIFLLALAPVMFSDFLLPTAGWGGQWWKRYLCNLFFPPAYMLLSLLSILFIFDSGFQTMLESPDLFPKSFLGGSVAIILNFVIAIGFMIGALIFAKTSACVTGGSIAKWGGKAIGAVGLGGTAFVARQALGRAGMWATQNDWLKESADNRRGKFTGLLARGTLKAGDKFQRSSFDARGTKTFQFATKPLTDYTGMTFGKAQQNKGLKQRIDEKAKREKEFADKYIGAPTPQTQKDLENARKKMLAARQNVDTTSRAPDLQQSKSRVEGKKTEISEIQKKIKGVEDTEKQLQTDLQKAMQDERSLTGLEQRIAEEKREAVEKRLSATRAEKAGFDAEILTLQEDIKGESYHRYETALTNLDTSLKDLRGVRKKAKDETEFSRKQYAGRVVSSKFISASHREAAERILKDEKSKEERAIDLLKEAVKETTAKETPKESKPESKPPEESEKKAA